METLKTINNRKSVRSYTGVLKDEDLKTVLLAGQEAPIAMGKYETMHMTVIRDAALLEEIDRNAAAFFGDPERRPLYGAPCFIVISTAVPNSPQCNIAYSNAAIMAESMTLAATDLKLGSCCIWGAIAALGTNPELTAKLNLPEGHSACCGLVLGETNETIGDRDISADRISVSYIG